MKNTTYYEILGVKQDADVATIREAYQRIARATHPDRATDPDPDRFDAATKAFNVLRSDAKRLIYDQDLKNRLNDNPYPAMRDIWESSVINPAKEY